MYYTMYLTGLCSRRKWPQPTFEWHQTRNGYVCRARVNNREYCTESEYASPELAKDAVACQAYILCRNFSANDGMYPSQQHNRAGGGVVQGLPVAIGTGRQTQTGNPLPAYATFAPDHTSNCGDSDRERRSSSGSAGPSVCPCGQLAYPRLERCAECLGYGTGY